MKDSIRIEGFEYIGSRGGPWTIIAREYKLDGETRSLSFLRTLALRRLLALGMEKLGIVVGDGAKGTKVDCKLSPSVSLSSDMLFWSDINMERVVVLYPERDDVLSGQQEELRTSSS